MNECDELRVRKVCDLESIAVCSVTFRLPWYTIIELSAGNLIQTWDQSSTITCKIDVIKSSDVHDKITYIRWPERRNLRRPLERYFACLFNEDCCNDSALMLECTRVLDLILSDLCLARVTAELYRAWALDIFVAVKKGVKGEKINE